MSPSPDTLQPIFYKVLFMLEDVCLLSFSNVAGKQNNMHMQHMVHTVVFHSYMLAPVTKTSYNEIKQLFFVK
jgi:hypothetical protein